MEVVRSASDFDDGISEKIRRRGVDDSGSRPRVVDLYQDPFHCCMAAGVHGEDTDAIMAVGNDCKGVIPSVPAGIGCAGYMMISRENCSYGDCAESIGMVRLLLCGEHLHIYERIVVDLIRDCRLIQHAVAVW